MLSYLWIHCEGRVWSHSSACGYPHCVPKGLFPHCVPLAALLKINCPQIHVDSILFYCPKYLFLFQYHTVLITIALWHTLNSNSDRPLVLWFWSQKQNALYRIVYGSMWMLGFFFYFYEKRDTDFVFMRQGLILKTRPASNTEVHLPLPHKCWD